MGRNRPPQGGRLLRTYSLVLAGLILCLFVSAANLFAQGGDAIVTGKVHDPSGANVPNASVTITNQATGETRSTATTDAGVFAFPALRPGTYTVDVTVSGFQKYERKDLILNPNQQLGLEDVALQVGSAATTVEVTSNADIIPNDTQEINTDITSEEIDKLAVQGRDSIELLRVVPGSVNINYQGGGSLNMQEGANNFSVNGIRSAGIATQLDGADVEDPGCNCGAFATPNREMISEINVQTSSFNAEETKGPIVFQAITKSGGRDFHGEAYYTVRNSALNSDASASKAAGQKKPDSSYQFPGGNIGGPVIIPGTNFNKNRDKLFFFGAYEKYYQKDPGGFNRAFVPTDAMLTGDFSALVTNPLPGSSGVNVVNPPCDPSKGALAAYCSGPYHIAPSAISPQGLALLKLFPKPNLDPNANNGANYGASVSAETDRYQYMTRIDYNVSDKMHIYARWNQEAETPGRTYGLWWGGNVPYPGNIQGDTTGRSLATSVVNTISSTLTNEVVVAIGRLDFGNTLANPSAVDPVKTGFGSRAAFPLVSGIVPNTFLGDAYGTNFETAGGWLNGQNAAKKWVNSAAENLSWVKGSHLMKLGAYYQYTTNDQRSPLPVGHWSQGEVFENVAGNPLSTGNTIADLLTGVVSGFDQSSGSPPGKLGQNETTFYAQDTWKANSRLTINYGLRIYHMGWMYDKAGNFAVFVPSLYQGPTCFNPGVYGCGTGTGQNAPGGGAAPVSSYSGLFTHNTAPWVSRSGRQTPLADLGPRFGFAYDVTGKGSTVLRGGFGTYYFRDINNPVYDAMSNPPLVQSYSSNGPTTFANILNPSLTASPSGALVLDPSDTNVPFTYEYNFTLSQKAPWQTLLQASYIGNSSHNLEGKNLPINYVPYGAMTQAEIATPGVSSQPFRLYQNWSGINEITNVFRSNYNGLQLLARKETGPVNFMVSYTFSKALGDGNGSTDFTAGPILAPTNWRHLSYGPLSYDRTHNVQLTYLWHLPGLHGGNWLTRGVINGWDLAGITIFTSGQPLNFNNVGGIGMAGVDQIAITGSPDYLAFPLLVPGCNPTANLASNQLFNAACFAKPTPGGPNGPAALPYYLRGPMQWSSDLSMEKTFHIREHQSVEVRGEAFNFLNKTHWTSWNGNLFQVNKQGQPDPTIGFETARDGYRVIELTAKYHF